MRQQSEPRRFYRPTESLTHGFKLRWPFSKIPGRHDYCQLLRWPGVILGSGAFMCLACINSLMQDYDLKNFVIIIGKNYMVSKFINRRLKVFWQYLIHKQYMISQKNQTLLFCFFHDVAVFIYFSVFRKFLLLTGSVSLVLVACFQFVNHWHDINKDKLNWLYGSPIMEGLAWIPFVALCARSHLDYKVFFFFL